MQSQPALARTIYAQLLEDALANEVALCSGPSRGAVARKALPSGVYLYWQFRDAQGRVRQVYLGPDTEVTQSLVQRLQDEVRTNQEITAELERATAAFLSAGGRANLVEHFRVVESLAQSGLFQKGAVLVGTHAFACLGNLLGVNWAGHGDRTRDIDFARDDAVAIAVSPDLRLSVPETLKRLKMGFFEVAELDSRQPSTSLATRKGVVKVDFLTDARRVGQTRPVAFPDIGFAATPLRFMAYLIGGMPQRALYVGRHAVAVTVPDPARFAIHKIVVSQERPAAFLAKARKDLEQAAQLVEALLEVRPGLLRDGIDALLATSGMLKRFRAGLEQLQTLTVGRVASADAVARELREILSVAVGRR